MNTSKLLTSEFLQWLAQQFEFNNALFLKFSAPPIFDVNFSNSVTIGSEQEFKTVLNQKFDLILGDLPFGMQPISPTSDFRTKINKNWAFILYSLGTLSDQGKAFFVVEPGILQSNKGKSFLQYLSKAGYYVNSVFELPEKVLYPETLLQPVLLCFEKKLVSNLFIGEITSDFRTLTANFQQSKSTQKLSQGILVERAGFDSFSRYRIESEISCLNTQYNEYTKYKLCDVAIQTNSTATTFQEIPNSIYIPKIGSSPVQCEISRLTLKHHNYYQVILKESIVSAEYVVLFYGSALGKLILMSLFKGSFIAHINKSDVEQSYLAIPSLEEQNQLIHVNSKLTELQENITQLKTELSLNPKSAGIILEKFESIQRPLKQLSEEDNILGLIRRGENKHVEFKETFSKNVRTGQKDKDIEKSSLKNIVGFLNSDGGILLIGVSDDGHIIGVEQDFYQSNDKYKLHFKDALRSKIGSEFYDLIDFELFTVNEKLIMKVECKPAFQPCFYDEVEFYVRTNPATDKLEGKKQVEYINSHFYKH